MAARKLLAAEFALVGRHDPQGASRGNEAVTMALRGFAVEVAGEVA